MYQNISYFIRLKNISFYVWVTSHLVIHLMMDNFRFFCVWTHEWVYYERMPLWNVTVQYLISIYQLYIIMGLIETFFMHVHKTFQCYNPYLLISLWSLWSLFLNWLPRSISWAFILMTQSVSLWLSIRKWGKCLFRSMDTLPVASSLEETVTIHKSSERERVSRTSPYSVTGYWQANSTGTGLSRSFCKFQSMTAWHAW